MSSFEPAFIGRQTSASFRYSLINESTMPLGSQVFVPGCTSSAGRVDLQVGVWVDHRELPGNLAAPPLAGWQYQALMECPNLSEVGLVRQHCDDCARLSLTGTLDRKS
jgi:hypothetical protein